MTDQLWLLHARAVVPSEDTGAPFYVDLTVAGRSGRLPDAARAELEAAMRLLLRASMIDNGEEPPELCAITVTAVDLPQIDWDEGGAPNGKLAW